MSDQFVPRDISMECVFCTKPPRQTWVFDIGQKSISLCEQCMESLIYEKLKAQGRL